VGRCSGGSGAGLGGRLPGRARGSGEIAEHGIQGGRIHWGAEELVTGHPLRIGGNIVHGSEHRLHLRKVRLNGLAQKEPIGRLQKNLRDQNIAPAVSVDPLDGIIRVRGRTRPGPAEGDQGFCQIFRSAGQAVNDQYFHWDSCLR
jgi:hypothetical protein